MAMTFLSVLTECNNYRSRCWEVDRRSQLLGHTLIDQDGMERQ